MIKTITVTQRRIHSGLVEDCRKCPIALAVNAHLKEGFEARVGSVFVCIGKIRSRKVDASLYSPYSAREFISSFDSMITPVKPFKFRLDIPEKFLKTV